MAVGGQGGRIEWVDRLRGLAVVGMMLVHSGPVWLRAEHREGGYAGALGQISGMVAPVFLFLAGLSVAIAARRSSRAASLSEQRAVRRRVSLRGLAIAAIGYAMHGSFWVFGGLDGDWRGALKVDVLQCIGVALAVLPWVAWPARRSAPRSLGAVLFFLLGAQLTWRLPLAAVLPDALAGYLTYYADYALFPLFPYAAWIALGMLLGPLWLAAEESERGRLRFWLAVAVTAAVAIAARPGLEWLERASGLREIPSVEGGAVRTTVSFFVFKAGVTLALLVAARLSGLLPSPSRPGPLLLLGRRSLFAYVLHLFLIFHFFAPVWSDRLTPPEHLGGFVLLAAATTALARLRHGRRPLSGLLPGASPKIPRGANGRVR